MSTSKPKILMANPQENTYIYICHNEHGETKKCSKATTAKAVTLKVETGQVALLIDKMNTDKSLPNPKISFLSFSCEVAARRKIFKCPGWCKFALDLGLSPLPELEK